MMTLNKNSSPCTFGQNQHPDTMPDLENSHRRRRPSQYAESICQFKRTIGRVDPRLRNYHPGGSQQDVGARLESGAEGGLDCVLPGTKRHFKLHVIIKKNKNMASKSTKQIAAKPVAKTQAAEQPKNASLLDSLFKLCEEHKLNFEKDKEKNENKEPESESGIKQQQHVSTSSTSQKRKNRRQKQHQLAYEKMYEKYQNLIDKFEQVEAQTFMI